MQDFDIDLDALRRIFLKKSKQYHPNFYVDESPEVQQEASRQMEHFNTGYEILKDPFLRAKHVLDVVFQGDWKETMPSDFLMEMMTWNERIDAAQGDERMGLKDEINQHIDHYLRDFVFSVKDQAWEKARDCFVAMKYFHRMLTRMEDALEI